MALAGSSVPHSRALTSLNTHCAQKTLPKFSPAARVPFLYM